MGVSRCSSSTSIDSGGMYISLSRVLRMRRTRHGRCQEKVAGISNSTCSGSKTRRDIDCLFFPAARTLLDYAKCSGIFSERKASIGYLIVSNLP